jgi:uncharacterized membrane protein YdjX (TVP38/TMEM64 family)
VAISKTTGGCVGFFVGRTLLQDWVKQKLASHPSFEKALTTMEVDGRSEKN